MPSYTFVEHISKGVPLTKKMVKDDVTIQLREWLAT